MGLTRPLFEWVVVREVIDNPQRYIDMVDDEVGTDLKRIFENNNREKGLLSDLSSDDINQLLMAPSNSIVGITVTPGYENYTPRIFYPMFPQHLSMPIKPGEMVWVVNPGTKDTFGFAPIANLTAPESAVQGEKINSGYWICRVPSPNYADDINFTHPERARSFDYAASQKPGIDFNDPRYRQNFSNGPIADGNTSTKTLKDQEFDYNSIREKSEANKLVSRDIVPRFTKRPGDLVIQGSNNTLICLGEDRPKVEEGSSTSYRNDNDLPRINTKEGTIDIVAGRGQSPGGSPNKPFESLNSLDYLEGEKRTWIRSNGRRAVKITEGDPDLIHDLSRAYISMKTDGDKNFGFSDPSLLPNSGTPLDPVDGKPYVVLKSNEIRIISRQKKDGEEIKENGSIRIIKEGSRDERGHAKDQAVITMQPDGTIMIDGPKIVIGSGNEKTNGNGQQVFIGGSDANEAMVLGTTLRDFLHDLLTSMEQNAPNFIDNGAGPGVLNPQILSSITNLKINIDKIMSKVGKTK